MLTTTILGVKPFGAVLFCTAPTYNDEVLAYLCAKRNAVLRFTDLFHVHEKLLHKTNILALIP
jgi:hypothetical protein